jgi:cell division protein FtsZ
VIAQIAREQGALTVGVVTKPFSFEGSQRVRRAEEGIDALSKQVDSVIVIPNERLIETVERRTSVIEAFGMADDVLRQGVQGITDLITVPGLINLDFADVRTIMAGAGPSLMGIGTASGEARASEAAKAAISSPLLETTVAGATGVLLNITGGPDLGLFEIDEAATVIRSAAHDECNVIFGAVIDEDAGDDLRVTVIATGFEIAASENRYVTSDRTRPGVEPLSSRDDDPGFFDAERPAEPAPTPPSSRPADISLDKEEIRDLGVDDDSLEVPDFLK